MPSVQQDMQDFSLWAKLLTELAKSSEAFMRTLERLALSDNNPIYTALKNNQQACTNLITHMNKGNELKMCAIPMHQPELFTRITSQLNRKNIEYVVGASSDNSSVTIIYKDCDEYAVGSIVREAEKYVEDKGHEKTYGEFMEETGNRTKYYKASGLSEDEVAIFRRQADTQDMSFSFTITPSRDKETGIISYDVLSSNKEMLERTINDILFVKASSNGKGYARDIANFDKERETFLNGLRDENKKGATFLIMDRDNPSAPIIEVADGVCRIHDFGTDKDNRDKVVFKGRHYQIPISHDLFRVIDNVNIKNPVALNQREASSLIAGKDKAGNFILKPEYTDIKNDGISHIPANIIEPAIQRGALIPPKDEPDFDKKTIRSRDFREKSKDMIVYRNMPIDVYSKIKTSGIDGLIVSGDNNVRQIAFPKDKQKDIDALFGDTVFKGLDENEKWLNKMVWEGRASKEILTHADYLSFNAKDAFKDMEDFKSIFNLSDGLREFKNNGVYFSQRTGEVAIRKDKYEEFLHEAKNSALPKEKLKSFSNKEDAIEKSYRAETSYMHAGLIHDKCLEISPIDFTYHNASMLIETSSIEDAIKSPQNIGTFQEPVIFSALDEQNEALKNSQVLMNDMVNSYNIQPEDSIVIKEEQARLDNLYLNFQNMIKEPTVEVGSTSEEYLYVKNQRLERKGLDIEEIEPAPTERKTHIFSSNKEFSKKDTERKVDKTQNETFFTIE